LAIEDTETVQPLDDVRTVLQHARLTGKPLWPIEPAAIKSMTGSSELETHNLNALTYKSLWFNDPVTHLTYLLHLLMSAIPAILRLANGMTNYSTGFPLMQKALGELSQESAIFYSWLTTQRMRDQSSDV